MEETKQNVPANKAPEANLMAKLVRLAVPVSIVVVASILYAILAREPEEGKRPEAPPRKIKTRVIEIAERDYQTVIQAQGVVQPVNEVTLTAQVSGRIVNIRPEFEDGAFFRKGDVLIELDELDFQSAVLSAEANLARTKTVHAQEQTRAKQARLNWEDLGYAEEPNELVLRLPQLREAEANVKAAEGQLLRAKTDLERSKIRAPYDGRVRQRVVGLGQTIGGSTPLGTIFAIDVAEVRLPIAGDDMAFLNLPEDPHDAPLEVELRDALNPGSETSWKAQIVRTEGALDQNSLELFAIARIPDPFGRQTGEMPLRIGQPVIGAIPGSVLRDVYAIPRAAVRQLEKIYLVDKAELTLSQVIISPIFADQEFLIVRHPSLSPEKLLAMTYLIYAPEGATVEILPEVPPTELDSKTAPAVTKTNTNT